MKVQIKEPINKLKLFVFVLCFSALYFLIYFKFGWRVYKLIEGYNQPISYRHIFTGRGPLCSTIELKNKQKTPPPPKKKFFFKNLKIFFKKNRKKVILVRFEDNPCLEQLIFHAVE